MIILDINLDVNLICFDIYKGEFDHVILGLLEETKHPSNDPQRERVRDMLHTQAWLRLEVLTNPGSK